MLKKITFIGIYSALIAFINYSLTDFNISLLDAQNPIVLSLIFALGAIVFNALDEKNSKEVSY